MKFFNSSIIITISSPLLVLDSAFFSVASLLVVIAAGAGHSEVLFDCHGFLFFIVGVFSSGFPLPRAVVFIGFLGYFSFSWFHCFKADINLYILGWVVFLSCSSFFPLIFSLNLKCLFSSFCSQFAYFT